MKSLYSLAHNKSYWKLIFRFILLFTGLSLIKHVSAQHIDHPKVETNVLRNNQPTGNAPLQKPATLPHKKNRILSFGEITTQLIHANASSKARPQTSKDFICDYDQGFTHVFFDALLEESFNLPHQKVKKWETFSQLALNLISIEPSDHKGYIALAHYYYNQGALNEFILLLNEMGRMNFSNTYSTPLVNYYRGIYKLANAYNEFVNSHPKNSLAFLREAEHLLTLTHLKFMTEEHEYKRVNQRDGSTEEVIQEISRIIDSVESHLSHNHKMDMKKIFDLLANQIYIFELIKPKAVSANKLKDIIDRSIQKTIKKYEQREELKKQNSNKLGLYIAAGVGGLVLLHCLRLAGLTYTAKPNLENTSKPNRKARKHSRPSKY